MKNFIPLILAVVLGMVAVFGVRQILAERESKQSAMVEIVAAAQDIPINGLLTENALMRKSAPRTALPAKAIPWSKHKMLLKQKTLRVIPKGDYIQWGDVGTSGGVSDLIGEGEWAISVPFSDSAIASSLRPGDEIAIVGTFSANLDNDNMFFNGKKPANKKRITTTILPRVRIISVGGKNGNTIVLSLNPEQAILLIDAQRVANLYPVLRKPHDDTYIDRLRTGMVDSVTYDKLLTGQKRIELPAIPEKN